MATVKAWSTKEEVLKDISRASGRRIGKKEAIESCLVIGDVPPPVLEEDDDDQIQMMFGNGVGRKAIHTEQQPPDLIGIQQMLRMVDDNSDDTNSCTRDAANGSDYVIAISKVSKLNPNVEEFVPKGVSSSCNNKKNNVVIPGQSTVNNNLPKAGNTPQLVMPIEESKKEVIQDMATTLRHKISDAAKSDSFQLKKEKNVAIATLLRLYATNDTNDKQTVKLIKPEYYEKNNRDKLEENKRPKSEEPNSTTNSSCCNSCTPTMSPHLKLDPEVKISIEKVNKWLLEPSKRKTQAVCLGPIEFKRKTVPAVKSPASSSSVSSKPSQGDNRKFQPSRYAAELAKKYEEKNKILQTEKQAVTWTNLEEKLREKDLLIKNRSEGKSSDSSSSIQ